MDMSPCKNLTACEEFMELVTVVHAISAAGERDIKELSTKMLSCDDQFAAIVKTLCSQKVCVAFSTHEAERHAICVPGHSLRQSKAIQL